MLASRSAVEIAQQSRFRILLICDSYPPVLGGSEIEAQRVGASLIARGHLVHVICSGGPPMPPVREWTDPLNIPVGILTRRSLGRWKDIVFALEVARKIWRSKGEYDIVYFLMQGLHVATGLPVARLRRIPIVMKISGSGIVTMMRASFIGRLELKWLRKWAVRLMLLNEGMADEAAAAGFSREQLMWMPNPVNIDEFRPALPGEAAAWRRDRGIPEHACVVIYVGRLSQEKGLRGLIGGFARAANTVSEALLLVVGDGPMRPELEALAREVMPNQNRIRFTGRIDAAEVPSWLRAGDIFALTSPAEGFSCALLEAMATGLASLVSDIPANRQLIDPEAQGIAVPYDSEEAIAQALLRLFGDRELRHRLGESGRRRVVENYSTDRVAERYEALFREAATPTSSAPREIR